MVFRMAEGSQFAALEWRRDRALEPALIDAAEAVTLDLFDTLLFRRCGDAADFQRRLAATSADLFADPAEPGWYPVLRRQAEAAARSVLPPGLGDVTIEAIYRALPPDLGRLEALMAAEWMLEQAEIVVNPFLLDLLQTLRRRGTPVLLISDMYWGEARLEALLDGAGVARALYRQLLVSCERAGSKADGRLFDIARTLLPATDPARLLHIGDDAHADVAMPAARGWRTIHYRAAARARQSLERESLLGVPVPRAGIARRLAAQLAPDPALEDGFWFDIGSTILGPVVDGFARWLLADCYARGIRRIAPILREGAVFARVLRQHAAAAGLNVETEPVHLSRQALYLPTLERFDREHLQRFGSASVYRTLGHLFARHLLPDCPEELAPFRDCPVVELIGAHLGGGRTVFDAASDLLLAPDSIARIEQAAQDQRALLLDYLAGRWHDHERVATVDFGANGTMNLALHQLRGIGDRWRLDHYFLYGTVNLAAKRVRGMSARVFTPVDEPGLRQADTVNRCPLFLELLLNGLEATTLRYRRNAAGRAEPITEVPITDPVQQEKMRAVHAGIDAYVALAAAQTPFDPEILPDREAGRRALGLLHRLVHLPTVEEARRLGDLFYDYNDEGVARQIVDAAGLDAVARLDAIGQPYLVKLAALARRAVVQWPEGALTRHDPEIVMALHLGADADFGHGLVCRLLLARLAAAEERSVILFAAGGEGGMGPAFLALAAEAGIAVETYLDYFPDRVGHSFHGIPTLTLDRLPTAPARAYAIVSTGYGETIEAQLRARPGAHDDRYYRPA
jgi:FMN phosphatase YigB (HAD superfamily)